MSKVSLAVVLAAPLLAACPPAHAKSGVVDRVAMQWQSVEASSPVIAEAFLQSLIALSEDDPWTAARARADAFLVAQQCGLVIAGPQRICAPCELPRREQDRPAYLKCLSRRLQCLGTH